MLRSLRHRFHGRPDTDGSTAEPAPAESVYLGAPDRAAQPGTDRDTTTAEAGRWPRALDPLQANAPIGFCYVDRDLRFLGVNEKAAAINGLRSSDHIGKTIAEVIPQFWPQLEPAYRRVLETGEPVLDLLVTNESSEEEGRSHSWLQSFYPVQVNGEVVGVGAVFSDITELKEAELAQRDLSAALRYQALHDPLTGLPNRALTLDRAEQMLAREQRENTETVALLLDLDDFEEINDTLGHAVGDQLLVEVAERLRSVVREPDTVGRLGGDEFAVLAQVRRPTVQIDGSRPPGAQASAVAAMVGDRVRSVFRDAFVVGDPPTPCDVSASVGIATGPRADAAELLRDADVALYRAKAAGRRGCVLFEGEMHDRLKKHLSLRGELRAALECKEYSLVYQPMFSIEDGTVVGVEALLRWGHPHGGVVPPAEFLPLLEESGQIVEVGREALRWACSEACRWREAGYDLPVSVNVSLRQLESRTLAEDVAAALEETGLDPGRLVIELAEQVLMQDPRVTLGRISRLKALGVRVAIDHFGTAYASLARLRSSPIDILKIDPTFVSAVDGSTGNPSLFHALVELGRSFGCATVAEGIEKQQQLDRLHGECETGQGFFYAEPFGPDDLMVFLAGHREASGSGAASEVMP